MIMFITYIYTDIVFVIINMTLCPVLELKFGYDLAILTEADSHFLHLLLSLVVAGRSPVHVL